MSPALTQEEVVPAGGNTSVQAKPAIMKQPISYEQIHETVRRAVDERGCFDQFKPTLILAIGAGGFIPARMLRTFLKHRFGGTVAIQAIGLQLYENSEGTDIATAPVRKTQWFSLSQYSPHCTGVDLNGQRILIVDEVDDTRKTLSFAVSELQSDIETQRRLHENVGCNNPWVEPEIGVFVVHNKKKPKRGSLPEAILDKTYFAGTELDDHWVVYPWDALRIYEHTDAAESGRCFT